MAANFDRYYAAKAADEAFNLALLDEYGPRVGPEARYWYHHTSPVVMAAREAFHRAADAWLAEQTALRGKALGTDSSY